MGDERTDWRNALNAWLENHSRTMPSDLAALRQEFISRFPEERIKDLTLEQFGAGQGQGTFCYWIEFGTQKLANISGVQANKFGLWKSRDDSKWKFDRKYSSAQDALAALKSGIVELLAAAKRQDFPALDSPVNPLYGKNLMRGKILYLYYPDFVVPFFLKNRLKKFLAVFGELPKSDELMAMNRQLLAVMRSQPEFAGFDTQQLMRFMNDVYLKVIGGKVPTPEPTKSNDKEVEHLRVIAQKTRNIILYGPPGTGKTWAANQIANAFLIQQHSEEQPKTTLPGRNYWWITANEKVWSWDTLFKRGREFFGVRRVAKNFAAAKQGDLVFCYNASPYREVIALARVEAGLHEEIEDGEKVAGITIIPIAKLEVPVPWQELQSNPVVQESEPVSNRAQGTLFALSSLEAAELTRLIQDTGNKIPQEFSNTENAAHLLSIEQVRDQYITFITFHQSFAYEEFVEGLKPLEPEEDAAIIQYRVVPGVFKKICERAVRDLENNYLLIIDEINRANISKVFGELITLIEDDKRLGQPNELKVRLPYSQHEFGVPPNLILLGTMNTADRSIALLDIALRRRFAFVEMMPHPELLSENLVGVNLRALLTRVNQRITTLLDRDHQLGHSYLLELKDADALRFAWYHRVVPLLQEYFYNDDARLREVLGKAFFEQDDLPQDIFENIPESLDVEQTRYRLKRYEHDDDGFLAALRAICQKAPAENENQ